MPSYTSVSSVTCGPINLSFSWFNVKGNPNARYALQRLIDRKQKTTTRPVAGKMMVMPARPALNNLMPKGEEETNKRQKGVVKVVNQRSPTCVCEENNRHVLCSSDVGNKKSSYPKSTLPSQSVQDYWQGQSVWRKEMAMTRQRVQPDRDATCVPTGAPCKKLQGGRSETLC